MRIAIAAIGRMKKGPEQELAARYLDRFAKAGPAIGLSFEKLSEFAEARGADTDARRREEAGRLAGVVPDGAVRIALDETGKLLTSTSFADLLARHRDEGRRDAVFLIGGPDGHDPALLGGFDATLSLGRMTFPHQIARILIAEQLYRAVTILTGHPYHRE